MYFWMVRLLTLIASSSSSPRMRSAPHMRPRAAMSRMRSIVSSGYTGGALAHQRVIESGEVYLQKPFTPEALVANVRAVLDRRG
jgi:hypothetical protein